MIQLEDLDRAVLDTEYAVRGPIVARAQELERAGRRVIYCNIGNPQSLGQRPVTFVRQVLSLVEWPELADRLPAGAVPPDVIETARRVLAATAHGLGAYTESKGYRFVREAIAEFIHARDGIAADPEAIFLTDGASKGAQAVLRLLIGDARDGVMIPIPQYPLYSATITLYGGRQVGYQLDEAHGWKLSREALESAHARARAEGTRVRGLVIINPGNPTGGVLDQANVEMVLAFAREKGLSIIADEVYQDNIWQEGERFVSFASALERAGVRDLSLFSLHSTSKGYLGECGHRGGYLECRNVPAPVIDQLTKLQSISLCANSVGQVLTYLLVHPPRPGEPSHAQWARERHDILEALRHKAQLLERALAGAEGFRSNPVAGAMYAFPQITLPPGVTDAGWCMALLEETGICVVDGTGFGQAPGTAHFRTTILPPLDQLETVARQIVEFHAAFTRRHRG